ncbi:Hypothetical predicted protein [Olea europaea subsp. europaea]|uniref:Uncharacterized protein n=1 Tax=Olea europaea subsp. europaea TaxID=158383 RepID=A0A8S0V9G3_OLEEU|nr:Hypothetical predicted protein [Olea europaea subsp. europaea]
MGSCISKCRSKKKFEEDLNLVHDKLVISQTQVSVINPQINDRPVSPAPSSVSSVSFSSFSCSNGGPSNGCSMASSLSSTSTSSSTAMCTKDRCYSNEFLCSCVKENPHVVRLNQTKKNLENSAVYSRIQPRNNFEHSIKPVVELVLKKSIVQGNFSDEMVQEETPKKRARASSPTIIRQKSFRKEQNSAISNSNRGLMRSPSPSRRFSGDNMSRTSPTNASKKGSCRNSSTISRANTNISSSSGRKRENSRPRTASPSHDLNRRNTEIMSKRDVINRQVNAKIDDISTGEVQCNQGMDRDFIMEDINNPLIALDCFIFL